MSSTPNRSTHTSTNHSEHAEGEMHEEDHVHVVENVISMYQANKIDKKNVWNVALIDVLDTLVRNHNAYIRNFRNIGISLDATMKIYEVRVDSVCNDVHRLRYGVGSNARNVPNAKNDPADINDQNCDDQMEETPQKRRKQRKKRRTVNMNIAREYHMNAPLNMISLPDDLTYRLNEISGDAADANRLFTTILPTKNALLQLFAKDKFFSTRVYDPLEFQDDCMYENMEIVILPIDLRFGEQLPIRQMLSGYRIQDNPIDDDDDEPEDDIAQDYAFDPDFDVNQANPMWVSQEDVVAEQDLNNNFDNALECDDIENADALSVHDISKGEYSYRAIANIRNYWAGPSYWKFALNRQSSHSTQATIRSKRGQRVKKNPEKPSFNDCPDNDSSDNDGFIKVKSKEAKKIRRINYRRWSPEKLMLPEKCDISKDLFEFYQFEPSCNVLQHRHSEPMAESNENSNHEDDDDDFFQMDFGSPLPAGDSDENILNFEAAEDAANISQNWDQAPQPMENIQIAFDKKAKVVNIGRLNRATLQSIDRQLVSTAANESAQNLDATQPLEPGRATFSGIFRDHRMNFRKFVKTKSDLTTGLVLFSVLNAVNKERLHINRRPDDDNDFDIVQLKKIQRLS
ncbi:condensin complex subunit 2-like isoform X2 [Sitodiplosis mosellana]|uniref:condensin complex subunit 2-like isoform X2 n=1 Tax=Sitodiplosis mosellana TaxID=263140 RepID=UPI00244518E2|nr:condensin complex subunit 2-like isoform X2 [Sitodiplosis mosellana]